MSHERASMYDHITTARPTWHDDRIGSQTSLFLFDLGGVVVKDIAMLDAIAARFGLDPVQLKIDYRHYEFPLMEGFIAEDAYWRRLCDHHALTVSDNPFATAFRPRLNDEVVTLIKALRQRGKRVVCASNTFDSHWQIMRQMGVLDLFDATYASHLLNAAKPKERFWHLILNAEGCDVSEAYFIDDTAENVAASRAMGIASLLYRDEEHISASERLESVFAPMNL